MPITEFPTIRIDDFKQNHSSPPPEIAFLTHMHEDHTNGLARKSYYGPIVYCTAATRALVLNHRTKNGHGELKYQHLRKENCGKEILKPLILNKEYIFHLQNQTIEVTLIDANHCPGAAMVLIKDQFANNAILFTGDLRCEQWHLNMISRTPSLIPFLKEFHSKKNISLYLDDTFQQHLDPLKEYPENRVGTQQLANLLLMYPKEVHFCLADKVTGHEEMLIVLAQQLNTKVHMSSYTFNFYLSASDSSPLARKLLECSTLDVSMARLHFCQRNKDCPFREPHAPMAYFKPCNQPDIKLLQMQNRIYKVSEVHPCEMLPFEENDLVFKSKTQRYFLNKQTKQFFPLFPFFHFSRHASFPELKRLVEMFNVVDVKSIRGYRLNQFNGDCVELRGMPMHADRFKIQALKRTLACRQTSVLSSEEDDRHEAMAMLCAPKVQKLESTLMSPPGSPPSFVKLVEVLRNEPIRWFDLKGKLKTCERSEHVNKVNMSR